MTFLRTIETWASTLRPNTVSNAPVKARKTLPRTTMTRKRSLGRTSLTGGSIESPKKSRLLIEKRFDKSVKLKTLTNNRIKTPVRAPTRKTSDLKCKEQKDESELEKDDILEQKEEKATGTLSTVEICERLRAVEVQVEKNTKLAKNRVIELLKENDDLSLENDKLQLFIEEKIREIRDLEEHRRKMSIELCRGKTCLEDLEKRLQSQSEKLDELEKNNQSLLIELSIAQKLANSRAAENRSLRCLLETEENKTRNFDQKLAVVSNDYDLVSRKLRRSQARLKAVHDDLLQVQGNIQVFARLRPLIGSRSVLKQREHSIFIEKSKNGKTSQGPFVFDKVFRAETTQSEIFDEVEQFVLSAVNGCNVCIFAYGQGGAGITHTLEGPPDLELCDIENSGLVPRSVAKIFEITEESKKTEFSCSLTICLVEIYNETVCDLLETGNKQSSSAVRRGECFVSDSLQTAPVTSMMDIYKLLEKTRKQSNERLSRSHRICQLRITCRNSANQEVKQSFLNFVNLAGPECNKDSTGNRSSETRNINSSLTQLLSVYSSLGNKASYVPFRNSKLTHLLSSTLDSNTKTLMLVHLTPDEEHLQESISSLKMAQKFRELHIESKLTK